MPLTCEHCGCELGSDAVNLDGKVTFRHGFLVICKGFCSLTCLFAHIRQLAEEDGLYIFREWR